MTATRTHFKSLSQLQNLTASSYVGPEGRRIWLPDYSQGSCSTVQGARSSGEPKIPEQDHFSGGDNTIDRSHFQFNLIICLHVKEEKKTGGDSIVRPHNRRDQSRTCVLQPILVNGEWPMVMNIENSALIFKLTSGKPLTKGNGCPESETCH